MTKAQTYDLREDDQVSQLLQDPLVSDELKSLVSSNVALLRKWFSFGSWLEIFQNGHLSFKSSARVRGVNIPLQRIVPLANYLEKLEGCKGAAKLSAQLRDSGRFHSLEHELCIGTLLVTTSNTLDLEIEPPINRNQRYKNPDFRWVVRDFDQPIYVECKCSHFNQSKLAQKRQDLLLYSANILDSTSTWSKDCRIDISISKGPFNATKSNIKRALSILSSNACANYAVCDEVEIKRSNPSDAVSDEVKYNSTYLFNKENKWTALAVENCELSVFISPRKYLRDNLSSLARDALKQLPIDSFGLIAIETNDFDVTLAEMDRILSLDSFKNVIAVVVSCPHGVYLKDKVDGQIVAMLRENGDFPVQPTASNLFICVR